MSAIKTSVRKYLLKASTNLQSIKKQPGQLTTSPLFRDTAKKPIQELAMSTPNYPSPTPSPSFAMDCTPPRKLPTRPPPLAITPYKALPNPSKATLPPKPPVTPTSMSPAKFHSPMVSLATPPNTPQINSNGRPRKYSRANDGFRIPVQQTTPTKIKKTTKAKQMPVAGWKNNVVVKQGEIAAVPAKFHMNSINTNYNNGNYNNNHYNNNNSNYKYTYNHNSGYTHNNMHMDNKNMTQPPINISKEEATRTGLQGIHNKLLGGATTLTAGEQGFLRQQMNVNCTYLSPMMMRLAVEQVTNKSPDLSYAIAHWAHRKGDLRLVEDALTDRLFNFSIQSAFDEGLMSITEVSALMDCQMVLHHVRKERSEKQMKEKEVAERRADAAADKADSDTDSVDMDLSAD
ncbi:hypothetical protein HD806DRAFT_542709 [Xylariaceae sp. AK1471]|nr:hypothetical protein HD806DRAFT_542709 [Xylariaceae sp. AK1471]